MIYLLAMLRLACLSLLLAVAAACPGGGRQPPASPGGSRDAAGPRVVLQAGKGTATFRVELARTDAERQRGLMFRTQLDEDAGMLFLFDAPEQQVFWMKNTLIPLDMIFIGADHRIVGIVHSAVPGTLTPRKVDGVSQLVLEVKGGTCDRLGIEPGTRVELLGI